MLYKIYRWIKNVYKSLNFILTKKQRLYFAGDFAAWEDAEKESERYDGSYSSDHILAQVADATQKVRAGYRGGVYEQDGVVFYEENNNYELLASLLYVYSKKGRLNVVDFGGALGSTFFRYKKLLEQYDGKWTVVEQRHFVEYGIKHVPEISFKYDITECGREIDVILLSSVLQYLDDTYGYFKALLEQQVKYIIIDRTLFSPNGNERIMLQYVPADIYRAVYPVRLLSLSAFKQFIADHGYEIIWEWKIDFENIPIYDGRKLQDSLEEGFLLKRRSD